MTGAATVHLTGLLKSYHQAPNASITELNCSNTVPPAFVNIGLSIRLHTVNVYDLEHDALTDQYEFDAEIPVCIYDDLKIKIAELLK